MGSFFFFFFFLSFFDSNSIKDFQNNQYGFLGKTNRNWPRWQNQSNFWETEKIFSQRRKFGIMEKIEREKFSFWVCFFGSACFFFFFFFVSFVSSLVFIFLFLMSYWEGFSLEDLSDQIFLISFSRKLNKKYKIIKCERKCLYFSN